MVALAVTSREEEPQIVVPLADVMIAYPGGSAEEVEKLVSARLERLLYQIDGVEYVYSMSRPGWPSLRSDSMWGRIVKRVSSNSTTRSARTWIR